MANGAFAHAIKNPSADKAHLPPQRVSDSTRRAPKEHRDGRRAVNRAVRVELRSGLVDDATEEKIRESLLLRRV
jgi:hypothetical protein